jgi:hypothetical protein
VRIIRFDDGTWYSLPMDGQVYDVPDDYEDGDDLGTEVSWVFIGWTSTRTELRSEGH